MSLWKTTSSFLLRHQGGLRLRGYHNTVHAAVLGAAWSGRWSAEIAAASPPTTTSTSVRYYRGQAEEAPAVLSAKESSLLEVAAPKAEAIRSQHLRLPDVAAIPTASLDAAVNESNVDIRRKRLIYRSKQRGWLEVDLLLGTWAHEHVQSLSTAELDEYEAFVNLETIDIYNVLTLRVDVPAHMKTPDGNGVVERIQAWARNSPLGQADPEKYKQVKTASKLI